MPMFDWNHLRTEVAESGRALWRSQLWRLLRPAGALRVLPELLHGGLTPGSIYRLHGAGLRDVAAIVDGPRILTYGELNAQVCRLANALRDDGVRARDRVVLILGNSTAFLLAQGACAKLHASSVPISPRLTSAELGYILHDAAPRAVIFDHSLAEVVTSAMPREAGVKRYVTGGALGGATLLEDAIARGSDAEPRRSDADPEMILYTSGTTGKPKGAVRTFKGSSVLQLVHLLRMIPLRYGDRHLVAGPLYHALPGGFATVHLGIGATLVLLRKFDAETFLATITRERITTATAVPTMLRALCELPASVRARYDLSSLRVIIAGGAALEYPLVRDFSALFGEHLLYNLYGATELGWVTVAGPAELLRKPHTIGRAVPGCDVALFDETRRPVADGEVGELFARSEMLIRGYHGNDEATRKSQAGDYFTVGDLARRDRDGFFFLAGRKVDMVVSGGVNVYPAEVEAALLEHPEVVDAAVVGVADPHWGEALRAFIVVRAGAGVQTAPDDAALIEFLRARLAGYKIPRQYRFLDELPRNPTGKVMKRELRAYP